MERTIVTTKDGRPAVKTVEMDTLKRKQQGIVKEAAKTGREIGCEMARQDVKWLKALSDMFLGWMKLILFGWMFSRLIDLLCVIW